MKINEQCLACLVNQAVKTANLVNAENKEALYKKIFSTMSNMDFSKTNPEIVGENYRILKQHTGCDDPYKETKQYYNQQFLEKAGVYEEKIYSIEDAHFVGMDEVATVISNGDYALGTILERTSAEFQKIYQEADFVIAKGQANYESLSEEQKNIYFLLMTKCKVIADDIGVKEKALVCMKSTFAKEK